MLLISLIHLCFLLFSMRTLGNNARYCTNPEIIASRLISIRNIYLRQELYTISNKIQDKYKERLPALHLVSIAAYEQVFNRRPLSLPEELRRDAVKYGLRYYQHNYEKLRMAEAQNGLYPNHDRISCFDKKCPFHGSNAVKVNGNLSAEVQIDKTQSNLSDSQHSISLQKPKSKHNSNESIPTTRTSNNTDDSIFIDTQNSSTSDSSDESHTIATNEQDFSPTLTFIDSDSASSLPDTSNNISSKSSSADSISESAINGPMRTTTTNLKSQSTKKLSRTKPPKIIVRRASDNSITSNNTKNLSMKSDKKQTSPKKQLINVDLLSPDTQRRGKKTKKYKQ